MIMGATGSAGRLAVQIARRLGASHVAAAGRDAVRLATLPALGADTLIDLGSATVDADLAAIGRDVDVVLDYLWGPWAARALRAIVPTRADDSQALTWVQIGSMTGLESPIPSAALRACNLRIVGSGQGSVSPRDILAELPALSREIMRGDYAVDAQVVALDDVTTAWAERSTARQVVVPD